jgi:subtilisin family serine protease
LRTAVRVAVAVLLLLAVPALALATNDPYRDQQWGLDTIGVDAAWEVSRGAGAVVAVIDTGVNLRHPDLRDRILRDEDGEVIGVDLIDTGEPWDGHGHGTLVAGIVAATADNGEGIAGVAPEARIMPIRVLDDDGAGKGRDVDAGIRWAVDNGADVINLSLESVKRPDGSSTSPGAPTAAVRYAWEQGVVVVAASGNNGSTVSDYPEESPVLLVGATDEQDRPTAFSDRGRPDAVLAPGVGIVSTWCRGPGDTRCDGGTHSYGVAEGTSFAAPHVAGVAALLVAEGHDAEEIVARIGATAVDVGDPSYGHGRVDAAAAVRPDALEDRPEPVGGRELSAASEALDEPDASEPADPQPAPEPVAAPAPEPDPPADPEPDPEPPAEPEDDPLEMDDVEVEIFTEPLPEPTSSPTEDTADDVVALPAHDGGPSEVLLQIVAAGLVGTTLAAWSAVARRLT